MWDVINAILVLILSFLGVHLSQITTKIAQDDKNEKTGHDLIFSMPIIYGEKSSEGAYLRDFAIINNKNRSEIINEIYLKKDDKIIPFWRATQTPLILSPYSTALVRTNTGAPYIAGKLSDYKIIAAMFDDEVELTQKLLRQKAAST